MSAKYSEKDGKMMAWEVITKKEMKMEMMDKMEKRQKEICDFVAESKILKSDPLTFVSGCTSQSETQHGYARLNRKS